ncbi:MFS transporter [Streptomyces sp. PU-14G]|uniref:MFS transporter n=1 Tax=Streptomyces sp. PU-14G TaxID=2800808 RepID=UPI0034DE803E
MSDSSLARPSPLLLPVVLLATFMELLDVTIVHVAVPSIRDDLDAGPGAVELVVAGYVLAYACTLICGARLGDRYGYRRLFVLGMVLFTVASAASAAAPSVSVLVAARVAQGIGGGLMNPQVLSTIQCAYAGASRTRVFGLYGATMGVASIAGPLLGGLLVTADLAGLGWRLIFLVNVPVGVAVLAAARVLPAGRGSATPLDCAGAGLITLGLGLLVLPLALGAQQGWPAWMWCCLLGALLVLGLFSLVQAARGRAQRETLLHPSLLRDRSAVSGLIVVLLFYVGIASFSYFFSVYQQAAGHSALHAGLAFSPFAVAAIAGSRSADILGRRLGHRLLVACGTVLACCMAVLAAAVRVADVAHHPFAGAVPLLTGGFAFGCFTAAGFSVVLANVTPEAVGSASGLLPTALNVGGALGITGAGALAPAAGGATGFSHVLVFDAAAFVLAAVAACHLPRRTADVNLTKETSAP